jgi:hypothetical protein
MSAMKRQEPAVPQPARYGEEEKHFASGGIGAASALDRMKAEHALRRKRQHGAYGSAAGPIADLTPKR